MFAKTLALLGIGTVLALIPTAAADHANHGCAALLGHDAPVLVDLNGLDECLAETPLAPQPLPGSPEQAGPAPATPAPPTAVADCVQVQPWSDVCALFNGLFEPVPEDTCAMPIGDRCLLESTTDPATEFFLALPSYERPAIDLGLLHGEPVPEAQAGLVPAVDVHCIAVYPYSSLCRLLP